MDAIKQRLTICAFVHCYRHDAEYVIINYVHDVISDC